MIDLYAWTSANGRRPIIMLEETGTPYRITAIDPHGEAKNTPEYRAISPGGKVPCLVDPDGPGGAPIHLMESSAILMYLGDKTGQFMGADERGRWDVLQWLAYLATNVSISFSALNVTREMEGQCRTLLGELEKHLGDRDYFAENYSIADMMAIGRFGDFRFDYIDLNDFPGVCRWRDRAMDRAAVRKATEMAIK
ncbi:MAG: glutathione S-transferase family protein [Rhodospirillaceae bacterium]|jgi:GST-like protein|nr:glutathione S-transferase family protein [Rhodospirillaceae bacterium]MBT5455921.1 glutathione S-transferase family protein [Rhodospirillaceae bacterium]